MKEPLWTIQNADLAKVLKLAFPKDPVNPCCKKGGYYHASQNVGKWGSKPNPVPNIQTINVSEIQFTKTITIKSGTYDHIKIVNGDVIIEGFVGVIE